MTMNKKQKKNLIRILISAVLMVALHFVTATGVLRFALYMVPYLVVGYDIILKALQGIKNRQPLDECLLMVIATVGAIVIAIMDTGDYVEAVAVMLFYQIGEWFQSYAVGRSRKNIGELMDIRPDYANIKDETGEIVKVDPDEIPVGSIILCKPGEKIPIDGVVVSGESRLDTVALTGESAPMLAKAGDQVLSGCINISGILEIKTSKAFEESTVSKILDLVENASSRKSKSENFISKFARIYTPVVVIAALVLALVPPIVRLAIGTAPLWSMWIYRALIFLVISCPCALVISIPLSFFAGIGRAGKEGVLVKGSNYLELLAQTDTVVFDKTGTLTEGVFKVTGIYPRGDKSLLELAGLLEGASSHPIAISLVEEAKENNIPMDYSRVDDIEEIPGKGIRALVDGKEALAGNEDLILAYDVHGYGDEEKEKASSHSGTLVHLAYDREYIGFILISDVVKETSAQAIKELRENGTKNIVMLTGDRKEAAEAVAKELGITTFYSGLLPADKVSILESYIGDSSKNKKESYQNKQVLAFVGDGVNDAPVLARADIGIAMGAMGSDAAIEAADVVLMDDNPMKIVEASKISRKCLAIVKENIWFAIGVKILCLILGAVGIANMWLAVFADVGVMVIAVLNAVRLLIHKSHKQA